MTDPYEKEHRKRVKEMCDFYDSIPSKKSNRLRELGCFIDAWNLRWLIERIEELPKRYKIDKRTMNRIIKLLEWYAKHEESKGVFWKNPRKDLKKMKFY